MSTGATYTGKNFPTPAIIDGRVCLILEVPDALEYRAAIMGQLEWLADWRCWRHSNLAYADPPQVNRDIAAMFAEMVATAVWDENCMDICERLAECLTDENPAVVEALANLIATNPLMAQAVSAAIANAGGFTPGVELTPEQAQSDMTPANIHDGGTCNLNAAWGASLYLTQSANRFITDFFEETETLTNTLERMQKLVGLIPAIGNTIENVASFADELYDDLKESYAGAYNETLEEQYACAIFCIIQQDCSLTVDDLIEIFAARLGEISPTVFASVITFIGTGTFTGTPVVDAMFYLYFTAMKFGQQFGFSTGIRPLTQLMGLGADQLASDNWETLCDCDPEHTAASVALFDRCGEGLIETQTYTNGGSFTLNAIEITGTGSWYLAVLLENADWTVELTSITGTIIPPADLNQTAYSWQGTDAARHDVHWNAPASPADFGTHDVRQGSLAAWCAGQNWDLVLFNEGAFSATFTATAL